MSTLPSPATIDFPPFQLDVRVGQLCRDGAPVHLRPKTFAVLQHLAERPGELVTKQALLDAIWNDVAVSEDVVRISVGELRQTLGDRRTLSRFIETVPRRGYRFVATLGSGSTGTFAGAWERTVASATAADGVVVGRTRERNEILDWLRVAASGQRQVGFVTGEAGIGKTTLVDTVLGNLRDTGGTSIRIGRGQCVEHYGGGEPYMPLLEALTALCRGSDGPAVQRVLREHAPEWLLHAIGVGTPPGVDRGEVAARAREHSLHQLADSLDALATGTLLVLVLEDVHWTDYSTLDLLSIIAQRRGPARLLILCTLRPAEAIAHGHPVATVKRELVRKKLCREILLGGLSPAEVASYLAARFPAADLPNGILPLLVDRSDGNPFFLVALVEHLLDERLIVECGRRWELRAEIDTLRTAIPAGSRAVIEPRLERLADDERRVLEAASVAGVEFLAHAVVRVAPPGSDLADPGRVEQLCEALVRRHEILRAAGEGGWSDGTTSGRYAFRHALYQQVIYQGLSPSVRRRFHQAIGEGLEGAHRGRTDEVASELAAHFERSGDIDRAVRYHGEAAVHARSRFAFQEARLHFEAALALIRSRPETVERLALEMPLLHALGSMLFAIKGYGDDGAVRTFARMRELAERLDSVPMRLRALDGLLLAHSMRAELTTARALAEETLVLAERLGDPVAAANTRLSLGMTLFNLGEVQAARRHAESVRAFREANAHALPAAFGISSCILLASASAYLGLVAQAGAMRREAVARAATLDRPHVRAYATTFAAQVCTLVRDVPGARSLAEEAAQLAAEYGLSVFGLAATTVRAWCDMQERSGDEWRAALCAAVDEYAATGQRTSTTFFATLLAEAHLAAGDAAAANAVVDAALAFALDTGQRLYEHELYRLKGEVLLVGAAPPPQRRAATEYFERALAIAAERRSLLFELRAATSLYRLRKRARDRLVSVVERFAAEDDCVDLRTAQALLGRR